MPNQLLNKLRSLFNKILRESGNVLRSYGYELSDASVENQSGAVSTHYVYTPTIGNTKVPLTVILTASNVGSVFQETIRQIQTLSWDGENPRVNSHAIEYLTGIKIDPNDPNDLKDISLQSVIKGKKGLLGAPLVDDAGNIIATEDGSGDWWEIAFSELQYGLYCETENNDAGQVQNQSLMDCVNWIHKYIDIVQKESGVNKEQLTHEEKVKRAEDKESQLSTDSSKDAFKLVIPILANIQSQLRDMYQDRLNEELSLDKLIPQPNPNVEESEATQKAKALAQEMADENYATEEAAKEMAQADSAKHINIKLQKIQGSEDIDILALKSNYLPGETLNDVDDIINQDEFFNQLTEEPQSFDIAIDADGFDIEPCNEFVSCPEDELNQLFMYGITFYRNLYILHWMAKGNDMMKTHLLSEEMYEELIKEIDTLGELLVEKTGKVLDLGFQCDYLQIKDYEFQESLNILSIYIQTYIDYIDLAYCNQDSDVQSVFDEWLRYWKKQLNYFVKGQEI